MPATRALLFVLAIGVSACAPDARGAGQEDVARPLAVQVASAKAGFGADAIVATGTVRARRETVLAFTTSGRISTLLADEGDPVISGQLLASLDRTQVGSAAAAAQARARQTESDLRRQRSLFASGWVTRSRLEAAEAAAATAQAEVRAAGFDVGAARIAAPGPGLVLRRHAEPGQIVAAGDPIVTVAEADGGYVLRVPLADRDLGRIRVGQPATVSISALGDAPVGGRVIELGARSDSDTGTFEAEVALPALAGLRSGLIGEVRLLTSAAAASPTVAVPPLALFSARAGEGFVYVVEQGRARARLVAVGEVGDGRVEITRGLRHGEQVIVSGIERLRDGMPVRPTGR